MCSLVLIVLTFAIPLFCFPIVFEKRMQYCKTHLPLLIDILGTIYRLSILIAVKDWAVRLVSTPHNILSNISSVTMLWVSTEVDFSLSFFRDQFSKYQLRIGENVIDFISLLVLVCTLCLFPCQQYRNRNLKALIWQKRKSPGEMFSIWSVITF